MRFEQRSRKEDKIKEREDTKNAYTLTLTLTPVESLSYSKEGLGIDSLASFDQLFVQFLTVCDK